MNLPKKDKQGVPYLSYSQISSFLKSPKEYMKSYFFNEPFEGNAYTNFGSQIGTALENNDFSDYTPKEQALLSTIPRLDEFEREIRLDFDGFYLKGFIDSNTADLTHLLDYKTGGAGKEEEYIKPTYIQPIIYALALKQKHDIMPTKAEVIFIERKGNAFRSEPLILGDYIKAIPIDITPERLQYAEDLIVETAKKIEAYYNVFLKLNK